MSETPRVDADWGGEHVRISLQSGHFDFTATIETDQAARLIQQLEWAIREVAAFDLHVKSGKPAGLYGGRAKP